MKSLFGLLLVAFFSFQNHAQIADSIKGSSLNLSLLSCWEPILGTPVYTLGELEYGKQKSRFSISFGDYFMRPINSTVNYRTLGLGYSISLAKRNKFELLLKLQLAHSWYRNSKIYRGFDWEMDEFEVGGDTLEFNQSKLKKGILSLEFEHKLMGQFYVKYDIGAEIVFEDGVVFVLKSNTYSSTNQYWNYSEFLIVPNISAGFCYRFNLGSHGN